MKKNLFFIAAAAIAFAACSNEEILVDNGQQGGAEKTIGFGTYAGKATRAENSTAGYSDDLSAHHLNFAVWGYKNTEKAKVFDNQTVEYKVWSGSDKTWNYTPLRYWDKAATTYYYYAAAPQTDENGATVGWSFEGTENADKADQNAHSFKLTDATLYGSNLSAIAASQTQNYTTTYVESFINAPKIGSTNAKQDIDYMIAEPKSVGTANFTSSPVELKFIHILSRLNITIKKGTTLDAAAVVTLKSLEVVNLNSVGTFTESSHGATSARPGANNRWSALGTQYTLSSIQDYVVTNSAAYVLQSLVIPQTVACETEAVKLDGSNLNATESSRKPYLKIVYTIDPDGTPASGTNAPAETYTAYYNLAAVFGAGTATSYASTVLPSGTKLEGYYTKNEYTACGAGAKIVADTDYYTYDSTNKTYTKVAPAPAVDADVSSYYTKTVSYTACDAEAAADGVTTYYQLVGTTLAFNEGWQNTLNLTIEPTVISFSTKVAEWADYVINDYTVE